MDAEQANGEPAGLTLVRWGLGFAQSETEAAYRAWHVGVAVPFTRIGMVLSVICWTTVIVVLAVAGPVALHRWAPVLLFVMMPVCVGCLAITYRPHLLRWMAPSTMFANCLAGMLGVALFFQTFGPELGTAAVVVIGFFGFTVFRLRPTQAVLTVTPYLLFNAVLCVEAGHLTGAAMMACSAFMLFVFIPGLLTCAVLDRVSRQAYRQERINESQRLAIEDQQRQLEAERARTELVLTEELRHQVRERSRELGEAFGRIEAATGVASLAAGERFGARYRVVRPLGAGAMGAVYEVERLTDGRLFALKVIPGTITGEGAARMAREAEIGAGIRHPNLVSIVDVGAGIRHPNLVSIVDVGIAPGGTPFLVMELVRGGSLEDRRARFGDSRWGMPILRQIAEGLGALHDAGVVHRDLKPANVLLAEGDDAPIVAKIADFGISRFDDAEALQPFDANALAATADVSSPKARALTGTGRLMGTPLYMPPEAARGGRELQAPADVFAFGTLAYELLAGRAPFAQPPMLLALVGQTLPVPATIDGVSSNVAALVLACLAGVPAVRPKLRDVRDVLAKRD